MLLISFQEVNLITPKVVFQFIKTVHDEIKHEKKEHKSGKHHYGMKHMATTQDRVENNGRQAVVFAHKGYHHANCICKKSLTMFYVSKHR